MKILIYLALIIGFLMFYQSNPALAMTFLLVGGGLYLYFKVRKGKGGSSNRGSFFSGRNSRENDRVDDIVSLFMLQNLMNSNHRTYLNNSGAYKKRKLKKETEIDKIKQEVLDLLDE